MNIFILDWDVKKCAIYHNNKHCIKQLLESSQLLCGVHHVVGTQTDIPYRLSHKNHPCAIWARESLSNYLYLCELGLELCNEYTYRYGKRHKSLEVIMWCISNRPNIPDIGFTEPARAMPDEYKVKSVVQSYRNYYIGAKSGFANWKNREVPEWFILDEVLV